MTPDQSDGFITAVNNVADALERLGFNYGGKYFFEGEGHPPRNPGAVEGLTMHLDESHELIAGSIQDAGTDIHNGLKMVATALENIANQLNK